MGYRAAMAEKPMVGETVRNEEGTLIIPWKVHPALIRGPSLLHIYTPPHMPNPLPEPGLSLWEDRRVRFYLAHSSEGSSPSGAALLLWAPGGVCGSYGGEPMVWKLLTTQGGI